MILRLADTTRVVGLAEYQEATTNEGGSMHNGRTIVRTIHQGETTEIQWAVSTHSDEPIDGYAHVHAVDGKSILAIPFRNAEDEPFVFVMDADGVRVYASEDSPPDPDAEIVWAADPGARHG